MSERFERGGGWERLRNYWWLLTVVAFILGCFGGGLTRYTAWYVDEQNRATALKSLGDNSTLILARLEAIDKAIAAQQYLNQLSAQARLDYGEHLHALDGRADLDRAAITDLHEQLAVQRRDIDTTNQRVLYLLDPKTRSRN